MRIDISVGKRQPFHNWPAYLSSLFANGEQGVWYDPADLSTLYQDSAGTTPVTALEQPVGLMLDKSKGLVLTDAPHADLSAGWASADARWTYAADSVTWAGGGGSNTTTFKLYLSTSHYTSPVAVSFTLSGYSGSGSCGVENGTLMDVSGNLITTTVSANGTYTFIGLWRGGGSTNGRDIVLLGRGTNNFTVSNISVRELPGNHASQATASKRPTLSARVNLLTYSEDFSNAAWTATSAVVTANQTTAPDGTLTADKVVYGATGTVRLTTAASFVAGAIGTVTVYVKKTETSGAASFRASTNNASAWNSGVGTKVTLTSEWQRVVLTGVIQTGTTVAQVHLGTFDATGANDADCVGGIYIWGAQLETGSTATRYQRVTTATDYDSAGFMRYLKCDGVDDNMATAAIDFSSTDKMTVCAGFVPYSSGTYGALLELSTSVAANNGSLAVFAPDGGVLMGVAARGTAFGEVQTGQTVASKYVVSGSINTAASGVSAQVIARKNGIAVTGGAVGTDLGAANFGNYPLYLFARAGTSLYFNGHFYGGIIRGVQSTAGDVINMEYAINNNTGAF